MISCIDMRGVDMKKPLIWILIERL